MTIVGEVALAQNTATAAYDPRITFAPLTFPDPVNAYRSSNGARGPSYWQNEASYEIHADLDISAKQLRATETITYTNNSPHTLPSIWIQLEQNLYCKDARGQILLSGLLRRRTKANVPPRPQKKLRALKGLSSIRLKQSMAWSASPAFVWDAARINLPDGKQSLAMGVYPSESVGSDAWDKSTQYVKDAVENFSKHWYPYPWPAAIDVAGFSTGMKLSRHRLRWNP